MLTPEPSDLELAAVALRSAARQLRVNQGVETRDERASFNATATTLDNVADWLDHRAAHATIP